MNLLLDPTALYWLGSLVITVVVFLWPKKKPALTINEEPKQAPQHDPLFVRAEDTVRVIAELNGLIDTSEHNGQLTPDIWGKLTCLRVHGGLLERWIKERK